MHRLALRGLMNAGVAAGDSRCRQTRRTWPRSLSLFYALFHYRLVLFFFFQGKKFKRCYSSFHRLPSKRKTTAGEKKLNDLCQARTRTLARAYMHTVLPTKVDKRQHDRLIRLARLGYTAVPNERPRLTQLPPEVGVNSLHCRLCSPDNQRGCLSSLRMCSME